MGHYKFCELQPPPIGDGDNIGARRCRRRPFSPFELWLLVPLVIFTTALAIFTIVYIVQHGWVKPAAIAALCATSILLVSIAYVVLRRLRSPEWCRDIESGLGRRWHISAPLPAQEIGFRSQTTMGFGGHYTSLSDHQQSCPRSPGLASKVCLAVKRTFTPKPSSKGSLENPQDDNEYLIRSSTESGGSSDEGVGEGLWASVFELPGPERPQRLSRYHELSAGSLVLADTTETAGVTIVVTKPQPAASPPRSRRGSFDDRTSRDTSLSFDPLRSHPVCLKRDPSVRQSKSAHNLASLPREIERIPTIRRSRSAEAQSERTRLGNAQPLQTFSEQREQRISRRSSHKNIPKATGLPAPLMLPIIVSDRSRSATRSPRPLHKSHFGQGDRDLRRVYRDGIERTQDENDK